MAKILVVDDDPQVRAALVRLLVLEGHTVASAGDGAEALAFLDGDPVDLVITDIVMPNLDGLEFLRRLRRREAPPSVIVVSGGGQGRAVDYLEIATLLGACRVLRKPFTPEDLRKEVEAATRK